MIDILCPLITKGDIRGEYWVDKNDLNNTYAKADLTLCQKSLTNQKKSAQWWLCLFTTGFCDVGKMLLKYKYQTHISCPWRRERDEDMFNVLCCADQGTVAIWNGKIHKLQVWMKSQESPPEITTFTIGHLNTWRENRSCQYWSSNEYLRQALTEQRNIGWVCFVFLKGFGL